MNNPLMDAASGNTRKHISADETMIYYLSSQEDRAEMAKLLYESIEATTPNIRYHDQSDKYIYVHDCNRDSNGNYILSSLTFTDIQDALRHQEQCCGGSKYGSGAFYIAAEEDFNRQAFEQDPDRSEAKAIMYQYVDERLLQKQHMAVFKLALLLSEAIKIDTTQHDFTRIINGKECRVSAKVDYTVTSDLERGWWPDTGGEYYRRYALEQRVIHLSFIIHYTTWLPNGDVQKETDKFLIQCSAHEQYYIDNKGQFCKAGNKEGRIYYSIVVRECLTCNSNGDVKNTSYDLKHVWLPVFPGVDELDKSWHDCCYDEILDLYDGMKYFDSCILPTGLRYISDMTTGKFDFIHTYDYLTEYSFCRFPNKDAMSCADMEYAWKHSECKDPNKFLMTIYSPECLNLNVWSLVNRIGFYSMIHKNFYMVPRVPGEDVDPNSEIELSDKMIISNVFSNFEYAMTAAEHFIKELAFPYMDCFRMPIWDEFRIENGILIIPDKQ